MRTIETVVTVEPDGKLVLQLPPGIAPGEHRIVLVIEEQPVLVEKRPVIDFPVIDVGEWPEDLPLRREDMYGDFGR
jgi:hypothetical protein